MKGFFLTKAEGKRNVLPSVSDFAASQLQKTTTMLRGALGLGGPGSPRRKGQQQGEENGNGSRNGGGGAGKLAAVLDAADDDGALASPRGAGGAGAAGEEDLAATVAGENQKIERARERDRERRGERGEGSKAVRERPIDRQKGAPRRSHRFQPLPLRPKKKAEHAARVRAEGAAADASRRLEVAQEQVHEYARARAQDAAEALAEAEAAVSKAGASSSAPSSASAPAALASLVALRDRLAQASEEARAFAELTRADAERARRSAAAAAEAAASGGLSLEREGKASRAGGRNGAAPREEEDEDGDVDMETSAAAAAAAAAEGPDAKRAREEEPAATEDSASASAVPSASHLSSAEAMLERARYIPLRLTADERRLLSLLKAALGVSQAREKFLLFFIRFDRRPPRRTFLVIILIRSLPSIFSFPLHTRTRAYKKNGPNSTPTRWTSSPGRASRRASSRR